MTGNPDRKTCREELTWDSKMRGNYSIISFKDIFNNLSNEVICKIIHDIMELYD